MLSDPMQGTCGSCRFWRSHSDNGGRCHRYPPTSHVTRNASDYVVWEAGRPRVGRNEFCGEYRER